MKLFVRRRALLPVLLVSLHLVVLVGAAYVWYAAKGVGPSAAAAHDVARYLDWPVYWIAEQILFSLAELPANDTAMKLIHSFQDLIILFFWIPLLLLGCIQWLIIGLVLAFLLRRNWAFGPSP